MFYKKVIVKTDSCCWLLSLLLVSSYTASFVLPLSLQECVKKLSPQGQKSRQSSLRLKWGCWMEDEGLTSYFRKNPSRASTNICLPSSLICVTGESCIPVGGVKQQWVCFSVLCFPDIFSLSYHVFLHSFWLVHKNYVSPLCLSVRESEDTALLLLKEIYDKQGVAFEQPQQ